MPKKWKVLGGIIVLVILAALGGFLWVHKHGWPGKKPAGNLTDKAMHLTAGQKKIYTDKIAQAQDHLNSVSPADKTEIANTYILLAQQYYGLGQFNEAEQMYTKATQENVSDPSIQDNIAAGLAATLLAGGDKTGAQNVLEQRINIPSNNPNIWLQYITLRRGMGATNQEITDLYGRALLNTNSYTDVITSDADFEESIGDNAAAIKLWQEAEKAYPDNKAMYDAEIERLQSASK